MNLKRILCCFCLMIMCCTCLIGCGKKDLIVNIKNLTLTLPGDFSEDKSLSGETLRIYSMQTDDKYNYCILNITYDNDTIKLMKEQMNENSMNSIQFSGSEINGKIWQSGKYYSSQKRTDYYYMIDDNGIDYYLEYNDIGSGNLCEEHFNKIINSAKFN